MRKNNDGPFLLTAIAPVFVLIAIVVIAWLVTSCTFGDQRVRHEAIQPAVHAR